MKFAVHWAPLVNVWTPGWTAPVPAADAADGANAMIASAQMPARTRRGDIPLPSFELVKRGRSRRPQVLPYPIRTRLSRGRFAHGTARSHRLRQLPAT